MSNLTITYYGGVFSINKHKRVVDGPPLHTYVKTEEVEVSKHDGRTSSLLAAPAAYSPH